MRYLRKSLLATLLCLVSMIQAQTNVLRVEPVVSPAGKALLLPIVMENTNDIAGVQFDISVPYELATDTDGNVIANLSKTRTANHQVTTRNMGTDGNYYTYVDGKYNYYKKYRIIVYSDDNTLFHGNRGALLTLKLTIGELADDTQLTVRLSNVTLSDPQMNNVMTSTEDGTITIKEIPRPDLQPSDITFTQSEVGPGGTLDVAWKVKNIGKAATEEGSGWSERIELVNAAGTFTKLVATTHFGGQIAAESEVSRSVQIVLPQLLTIDGITRVQVTIVPDANAGEDLTLRDNNTAKSVNNLMVTKKLTLEISPDSIGEDSYWKRVTIKLTRSGSWSETQSFKVTATNSKGEPCTETRIALPEIINIMERESAAILYLDITNNNVLDNDRIINLKVEPINTASTYAPVTGRLIIEDDELPDLTLTASKSVLTEGETFQLTVTTTRVSAQPITVTLTSENAKRFSFPQMVTIPAGETSVTVDVTAKDDDVPSEALSNAFTASASRYNKGETIVVLEDDDMPVLELQLTPTSVQESAGVVAVAGVLRRITKTNSKITVKLTDDSDGELYFGNRTLVLDKGVEEVHFNFGPVDNAQVDGDRTYTITASVWLSSCSCSAAGESAGSVTEQLQVLDDDGQALALTSSLGTVKEGGKTELTISRNTATGNALTVTLSSDYDDNLSYNHTVVIPAGQKSTTVEVTSASNNVSGDTHTVVFTVAANGYSSGTCFLMVTDQTLPDARISSITADITEAEVGTKAMLTLEIINDGIATLPAEMPVKIYRRGETDALGTIYTSEAIPAGGSEILSKTITLPTIVGTLHYYAVVKESNKVQELSYNNNTSADITITTMAPFSVSVNTDKSVYKQGEKILISGQLTGKNIKDTNIDIYLVNDGARQVQTVKTDSKGAFSYEWQLYDLQLGHFAVGACYPNEGLRYEKASFDVYGLKLTKKEYVTCEVLVGETYYGEIEIENPCNTSQDDVHVELLSELSDCNVSFESLETIGGGKRAVLKYQIMGLTASTGDEWNVIKARVVSSSGASMPLVLYYYCRMPQAQLYAGIPRMETTIQWGSTREYPLTITNRGAGESGVIKLTLPSFMSVVSSQQIPSLLPNESATIILRISCTDKMQINIPVSGNIGLNCEYGNGVALPYTIVPVSESEGELLVDVCDEYTYYTDEKPHVKGAKIKIQRPLTKEVLYEGITGDDGLCLLNMPVGYYSLFVTADKHESYERNILIDPGKRNSIVVNLSYEGGISVDWNVVETEIEDEYTISTTITYETNVPVPILDLEIPESIPANELGPGESLIFYAILTNRGLITIHEAQIILPDDSPGLIFESLQGTIDDLPAKQSIIIPVKVTRIAFNSSSRGIANNENSDKSKMHCAEFIIPHGYWDCGVDKKWYRRGGKGLNLGTPCTSVELGDLGERSELPLLGRISGASFNPYIPNIPEIFPSITTNYDGCEPCLQSRVMTIANYLASFIPGYEVYECIRDAKRCHDEIRYEARGSYYTNCLLAATTCLPKKEASKIYNLFRCLEDLSEPCNLGITPASSRRNISDSYEEPGYITVLRQVSGVALKEINGFIDVMLEYFGDSVWVTNTTIEEQFEILTELTAKTNDYFTTEGLKDYKPDGITVGQLTTFVERLNNSMRYEQTGVESKNRIHPEIIDDAWEKVGEAEKEAVEMGYTSVEELFQTVLSESYEKMIEKKESVCASISLQFDQAITMTRQAFRGTLKVFNGNENTAMENVKLTMNVTNMTTGEIATSHEFQINVESLDGFTGELDHGSGWTLDANSTGTATILFIPTKYAAPDEPVDWSFGGTLSYIDPFAGSEVTRELYPVTLTVKPSPELDLTYFMQRDVYGDDALTLDVIEPMKPAEFALLINNKGNGDATNVRMVTQQPEIIDNEKGLYIGFELISSQLNGGAAALSFGQSIANDFGTIPAHSQTYAQWWLTSSLLGHFTAYDVQANHITSYGNEDLSLLGDVTIHELIRSLDLSTDSKKMVGFLVNDITDSEDMPDMVYLSNGETKTVSVAATSQISKTSRTTYSLTVTPLETGWTYGSIKDPTYGMSELKSIVRQRDGKEINLRNFWQTDRTLRDGKDPLYEYRIHFADEFNGTTPETYILTFDSTPDVVLSVSSITAIPEEGNIAEEPIDELTVSFNKKIDASTFTGDDITFAVQGVKQDASQIGISTTDSQKFTLDMSEMNPSLGNGYYTLTVQTDGITDNEGFQGKNGKQVAWILFRGGLVQLLTSTYPENSGSVMRKPSATADARGPAPDSEDEANTARYGSTVTLVAEPATGYEFANWTLNGEVVSTDAEFETTALGDMNIVANFTKKKYMVNVNVNGTGGSVEGAGTGIYDFGTEISITAVPDEDFMLKGWAVNGKAVESSGNKLTVTADNALDIDVSFIQEYYRQSITFSKGWNWISTYLGEPLTMSGMNHYANRIISQTGELINDPEFGMVGNITEMTAGQAYKIEANSRFTNSFRGHLYDVIAQPVNLRKGWNWIPFPFMEKAPIDALTSAEEGDYITSQTGFAEFADGTWEGTLNMFTPGKGYLYKSVSGKNLTFDTSMSISSSRAWLSNRVDVTDQDIDIHRYPNTMNVIARIYQEGTELQGDIYCIYAVVGDELRGISQYLSGNHYLTVYGDGPVDITFLVESTETAETYFANEVLTFCNDVVGSRKSPFAITINNATGIDSFDNSKTMTVYTVEGVLISRDATLKTLRRLPKGIYIVNGQKRFVK